MKPRTTKKPRNQETQKPRNRETKKPRNQQTQKPRDPEIKRPRDPETQKPGEQKVRTMTRRKMNAAAARTKFRHEMTALARWEMTKIPRWKITKIPRCNISIFSQWEISPSKHNALEGGNTNREPPTSCISSEGFGFEAYQPASVDFDPRNDISSVGKMIYISSINILWVYIYIHVANSKEKYQWLGLTQMFTTLSAVDYRPTNRSVQSASSRTSQRCSQKYIYM